MRKEAVLFGVRGEKNVLQTIKSRKAKCFCHILRRNCLLEHTIEGNIEGKKVRGRRGRRCEQPLDDLKEKIKYSKLKVEALDRTLWLPLSEEVVDLS